MKIKQVYHDVVGKLKEDYPLDNFGVTTFIAYIIIPVIAIFHSFFASAYHIELVTKIAYTTILGLLFLAILTNKEKNLSTYFKKNDTKYIFAIYALIPIILILLLISPHISFIPFVIPALLTVTILLLLVLWLEGWALPILFGISVFLLSVLNFQALDSNIIYDAFAISNNTESEKNNYGIFGIAWQAMMNTVYAFLLLTAALRMIRIDKLLNFLAFRLTHGRRQGASAGLYALIDSTLYGSISGSPEDNFNKTGRYTIRLMRQSGYGHVFAASIEAVASSAGKVIPPVMGVTAFIILEAEPSISYLDLMMGSLLPAFLFLFALGVAIAIEANKRNLQPLDINYAQKELEFKNRHYDTYIKFLTRLILLVIGVLFLISLIPVDLPLSVYPVTAAIVIFITGYWSPRYRYSADNYQYYVDLVKSFVQAGKDGVLLAVSCAMIGLLLLILQKIGLFEYAETWSMQMQDLLDQQSLNNIIFLAIKIAILALIVFITLYLGKHLPAIAVYLLMALSAPPFLAIINIEGLHAHLFLLYYAIFSGLTPPYAPTLERAAKAVDSSVSELMPTVWMLTHILLALPIAWAFHPEIILNVSDIFNFNQDMFIIFNIIALMLAIIGTIVASFQYFRQELSDSYRFPLQLSALAIVLPVMWLLKFIAIGFIVWVLAKNDLNTGKHLNAKRQSFFRPAFELVLQVTKFKNIPVSTYFTFVILAIVYIGLFTINGFALNFDKQIVQPLYQDRFQVMLGVEQCDASVQKSVSQYFKQQGYPDSSSLCTQFTTQASLSKQEPGEFGLVNDERQISIIGFQLEFFHFIKYLESSLRKNFEKELMSYTGGCFRSGQGELSQDMDTFRSSLRDVSFDLNARIEHSCNQYTLHELPVVYVGKQLANKINVSTGTLIRIHDRIYIENMNILGQKINNQNAKQFFVVGAVFDTGIHAIDTAILMPQSELENLDFVIQPRLLVKLENINGLNELQNIDIDLLLDKNDLSKKIGEYDSYSFTDTENSLFAPINNAVNTLNAIQYSILVVCLVVLVSAMIQLVESQARMIALMRMSGLHGVSIWLFLFLLSSLVVTLACGLGIVSTFLIDITNLSVLLFGNIEYEVNWIGFMQLYGTSLIFALITTILLKILYFSHDIFRELMYANRRA